MPEGRFVLNDGLVTSESPLGLEDSCFLPSTAAGLETSKGQLAKAESMSSLPDIPDIFIPLPLFNPLPLQCLAANALPDELKSEIDSVIALYSGSADPAESTAGGPRSDTVRDASPEVRRRVPIALLAVLYQRWYNFAHLPSYLPTPCTAGWVQLCRYSECSISC